ncbi:MAG: AAA family ATPase [Thermodesulfobacteriota bacterium]
MDSVTIRGLAAKVKAQADCRDLYRRLYPDKFRERGNSHCFHEGHTDTNPSLSVQTRYLRCHTGCTPEGKTRSNWDCFDLWRYRYGGTFRDALAGVAGFIGMEIPSDPGSCDGRKTQSPHDEQARTHAAYTPDNASDAWDYTDESGRFLYRVARFDLPGNGDDRKSPKEFRPFQLEDGRWVCNLKGVRRVLYRLPRLLRASPRELILLVEGEKCADAAISLGFAATTWAGGANAWQSQVRDHGIHEPLRERRVVIIPDHDEPGEQFAGAAAQSLVTTAATVQVIRLPGLPPAGDIVDYMAMHGLSKTASTILELIEAAPVCRPEPKVSPNGPTLISFADVRHMDLPEPRWIIRDLLPEGLCVLAGAPKIGKSWLVQHLSISVASGTHALGAFPCAQGEVLHLALEDNLRRFNVRMGMMLGDAAAPAQGYFCAQWPYFSEADDEVDGLVLLHKWLQAHREHARMVVIDTLAKIRPRRSRNRDDLYSRDYRDLEGLQGLASAFRVAIVIVHHKNKGMHADEYNTISGSTGITGCADTVMILSKPERCQGDGVLFISGRDIRERRVSLVFDKLTGLWRWIGDVDPAGGSDDREYLRDILRSAGRPMKPSEIAAQCRPEKTVNAVQKTLRRLMESGEVVKAVGQFGKYLLAPGYGSCGQSACPAGDGAEDESSWSVAI